MKYGVAVASPRAAIRSVGGVRALVSYIEKIVETPKKTRERRRGERSEKKTITK